MRLTEKLSSWNQWLDKSGIGIVFKCIATGVFSLILLLFIVRIFPAQRLVVREIAPAIVGLSVGFVYGCNGGPVALLFGFAILFSSVIWDENVPLKSNLLCFTLYTAVYYVGLGLSYLVHCRKVS